jgi:predicted  nucleic acid-binding Zn-ribbon protein
VPLTCDPFVQRRLLELARLDQALAAATHRRRTLPELALIESGTDQVMKLRGAQALAEAEVSDLDRAERKLTTEIEQVRARAERDGQRLATGSGPAKDLTNLQHEMETLRRRQGVLEDQTLDLMERRESAEQALTEATNALDEAQGRLTAAQQRRDEVFAELEQETGRHPGRGLPALGGEPADVLGLYERIHATGRVAAAELLGSRCGACRIDLDRTALAAVHAAKVDAVVRCDECGAILIRS